VQKYSVLLGGEGQHMRL